MRFVGIQREFQKSKITKYLLSYKTMINYKNIIVAKKVLKHFRAGHEDKHKNQGSFFSSASKLNKVWSNLNLYKHIYFYNSLHKQLPSDA